MTDSAEHDGTLQALCPHCGKGYRLKSSLLGKKAKCGACQQSFTIAAAGNPEDDALYNIEDEAPPRPVPAVEIARPAPNTFAPPPPPAPPPPEIARPAPNTLLALEQLSSKLELGLKGILGSDEPVYVKLNGGAKEGLICTDTRVILLKRAGFTSVSSFQAAYGDIAGAEVKFHLLTGHFELSVIGMQTPSNNHRSEPNCILLNSRDQASKFREVCSFILRKRSQARSPNTSNDGHSPAMSRAVSDPTEQLERLAKLLEKGLLSEQEFRQQKQKILERM